jgi:hypothetical protein
VAVPVFLFNVCIPYVSAFGSYRFCHFRLCPVRLRWLDFLAEVIPIVASSLLIGSLYCTDKPPPWLFGPLTVIILNRSLFERHTLALALVLFVLLTGQELSMSKPTIVTVLCFVLSRKLFSVVPIMDCHSRCRCVEVIIEPFFIDDECPALCQFLIAAIAFRVPGPDNYYRFPALVWSMITGAPFISVPSLNHLALFPTCPRPNVFWGAGFSPGMGVRRALTARLTEHPVETPVYVSFSQTLIHSFSSLINSGALGIVDSNDILFFVGDGVAAFIHVFSLEPYGVRFQLRGLEYRSETSCHRDEMTHLLRSLDRYGPCRMRSLYETTSWEVRAQGISLGGYSMSLQSLSRAIYGLDRQRAIELASVTFVWTVRRFSPVLPRVIGGDVGGPAVARACQILNVAERAEEMGALWAPLARAAFPAGPWPVETWRAIFDGRWECELGRRVVLDVIAPAFRQVVLVLVLTSMGLGPENNEEELRAFLADTAEEYAPAAIASNEFVEVFAQGEKDLLTVLYQGGETMVAFFRQSVSKWNVFAIQREVVRTFWATETQSQVFWGEHYAERESIQSHWRFLHNLILQSADSPTGYPALVSQTLTSYGFMGKNGYHVFN